MNIPYNPNPEFQRQATVRRIRWFVKIVVILLVVGFVLTFASKSMHAHRLATASKKAATVAPLVDVITAEKGPATMTLTLPGETAAWNESVIYARVDGYVSKWMADIGDPVKKGQVLAIIETPDLDAQLVAAQAKLQSAESLVKAREAEAQFAKTTYARWKDAPKGVVSEQEREAKKAGYTSAVAAFDEAKSQVAIDAADVDRYSVLAKFKQVIAPFDGKIIERRIDIGNLVSAGSGTNTTSLYRLAQNSPIRVFIDAPQSTTAEMKPGVTASITASSLPGQVFTGKIARTGNAINQQSRTLRVEVDLPNKNEALVSGMYVDVAFDVPTQGLLALPAAAILFRSSGPQVAVVSDDQHIQFHPIVIARDDGNSVEIASGIAPGDQVALNISNQITDGQKVTINHSKESSEHAAAPAK